MAEYTFRVFNRDLRGALPPETRRQLLERPCVQVDASLSGTAGLYRPSEALENAMNTALAVGEPLLLTGEAGTGKTQAAYYAALQLDVKLFPFQVKSNSVAGDLLYHFDTVRYFHDAHFAQQQAAPSGAPLDKRKYIEKRPLWQAFDWAQDQGYPAVLLIDEIDKAPRDFPNDLLHELDQMSIPVRETGETHCCPRELRPVVFITSNDERRLPPAFLRRCVSHHIRLTDDLLWEAIDSHRELYPQLNPEFLKLAVECFWNIRHQVKEKLPATGELLVWLQVLATDKGCRPDVLKTELSRLPHLGALIKQPEDLETLRRE